MVFFEAEVGDGGGAFAEDELFDVVAVDGFDGLEFVVGFGVLHVIIL